MDMIYRPLFGGTKYPWKRYTPAKTKEIWHSLIINVMKLFMSSVMTQSFMTKIGLYGLNDNKWKLIS